MNLLIRTALVAVVLGLLAVCVFSLRFACTPAYLSSIHLNEELKQFLSAIRRNEELVQLREATFRRVEARRRVACEVIDGRLALAEALERFEELDQEWPDYREETVEVPALGSREERDYHYILAVVEEILHDRPEEAAAVLRRLEKEYQHQRVGEPVASPTTPVQVESNP